MTSAPAVDLEMLSPTLRRMLATIPGEISEREGLGLAWLAAQVPAGCCIVEVGSYMGRSACYLGEGAKRVAAGGPRVHVYAVDLWLESPWPQYADPASRQAFDDAVGALRLADHILSMQAESIALAATWCEAPVGLLFLDADHTFEAVVADYQAWQRHIPAGGFLALHDAADPQWGVRRAIDEVILPTGCWEAGPFITGDLAVLVRRADP